MDVSATMAIVGAIAINGMSFFDNKMAQAQALQAYQAASIMTNQIFSVVSSSTLACSNKALKKQGITTYKPQATLGNYIQYADFYNDCKRKNKPIGYIVVQFNDSDNTKASLHNQFVRFRFEPSANHSAYAIKNCETSITSGGSDGADLDDGMVSPILNNCIIDRNLANEIKDNINTS